jgi:hypothetical protein
MLIYCLPEWWQKEMDGVEKKNLKIKKKLKNKTVGISPNVDPIKYAKCRLAWTIPPLFWC